jgi:RNA polymerase sigma factor (sigma-70 family)
VGIEKDTKEFGSGIGLSVQERVELANKTIEKYGDFIRSIIFFNLGDHGKADDVFQDFYLSLINTPIPADIRRIKGYIHRAVTNDIIDAARKEKSYLARVCRCAEAFEKKIADYEDPQTIVGQGEEILEMFRLIERQLPFREAEAIVERFVEGSDIDEGAKKMGVNKRTFSRYICMGLKKIRDFLKQNEGVRNGCA